MLSPLHEHPLEKVNPLGVYQAYKGQWNCDNCNSENGPTNPFPFHCRQCPFDLCYSCMHIHHQANKMLSPLHEHPLEQVNPLEVYQAYKGQWKCDNCNSENGPTKSFPFHCRQCPFDLCYSCMHIHYQANNLIHQHHLLYMETSRLLYQNQNGIWRCAICKETSDTTRETFSFHCSTCSEFDICRSCYEPKRHPIHNHELKVVDTSLIYTHTGGSWICDICGSKSKPHEVFSHHCGDCQFDMCQDCFKPHITPLHKHPLYRADMRHVYVASNGVWECDRCRSLHNNPVDNKPWHCQTCQFDLCNACMSSATVEDVPPQPNSQPDGVLDSDRDQTGLLD